MPLLITVIILTVVGVATFMVLTTLGTLKSANSQLVKSAALANRAAGIAESNLRSAIHSPLVDRSTAAVLELALSEVTTALDESKSKEIK